MQAGSHLEDVSIKLCGTWLETCRFPLFNSVRGLDPLESAFVIRDGKYGIKWFDGLQIPENVYENSEDYTLKDDNGLYVYSSTNESDESDESDED